MAFACNQVLSELYQQQPSDRTTTASEIPLPASFHSNRRSNGASMIRFNGSCLTSNNRIFSFSLTTQYQSEQSSDYNPPPFHFHMNLTLLRVYLLLREAGKLWYQTLHSNRGPALKFELGNERMSVQFLIQPHRTVFSGTHEHEAPHCHQQSTGNRTRKSAPRQHEAQFDSGS